MRFRTRTQEVEAIQWTGDNLEEVEAWLDGYRHQIITGPPHNLALSVVNSAYMEFTVLVGQWIVHDGVVGPYPMTADLFNDTYAPVPDLVRTAEGYEALPDGTILEVLESDEQDNGFEHKDLWRVHSSHGRKVLDCMGWVSWPIDELIEHGVVCRVVELGGDER